MACGLPTLPAPGMVSCSGLRPVPTLALHAAPSRVRVLSQRASVTLHALGVQSSAISALLALPLHVCGPVRLTSPAAVTEPLNPLKGAAKAKLQPVWVTSAFFPTKLVSQCSLTVQLPLTFGQLPLADESSSSEPQATRTTQTKDTTLSIQRWYPTVS